MADEAALRLLLRRFGCKRGRHPGARRSCRRLSRKRVAVGCGARSRRSTADIFTTRQSLISAPRLSGCLLRPPSSSQAIAKGGSSANARAVGGEAGRVRTSRTVGTIHATWDWLNDLEVEAFFAIDRRSAHHHGCAQRRTLTWGRFAQRWRWWRSRFWEPSGRRRWLTPSTSGCAAEPRRLDHPRFVLMLSSSRRSRMMTVAGGVRSPSESLAEDT